MTRSRRTQSSTTTPTLLTETGTVGHLFPQLTANTRYHLMLQLGGLLSQLTPGHHAGPYIQLHE